jgi:hypothetical protein
MEETVLIEQGRLRKGREEVKREIRGHTAFPRPSLSSGVTLVNTAAICQHGHMLQLQATRRDAGERLVRPLRVWVSLKEP